MRFCYKIYGLNISSSRKINILDEKASTTVDLTVDWNVDDNQTHLTESADWTKLMSPHLENKLRITFFKAANQSEIIYKVFFLTDLGGIAAVINTTKNRLIITHHKKELQSNLDSYFVGVFLGCFLRLKNVVCLHASVVSLNNTAILLLGKKKSGKSTTAGAFAKLGYKVLSDDIAVIKRANDRFYVESGYPKVRLRPKSLALLHPEKITENFLSVNSHKDSRYASINDNFEQNALPVSVIYVLGETPKDNDLPFVEPLSAERMILLHQNTFAPFVVTPELRKSEFKLLGEIAAQIPIRNLRFGRNVEMVNQQCLAIIKDFELIKN